MALAPLAPNRSALAGGTRRQKRRRQRVHEDQAKCWGALPAGGLGAALDGLRWKPATSFYLFGEVSRCLER
jgi:hypothetical protein